MRLIKVLVMVLFLSGSFNSSFAESQKERVARYTAEARNLGASEGQKFSAANIGSTVNKHLMPTEEDREFIRKNKDKLNLTEDDILDVSRWRFDKEVAANKAFDPNAINSRDLNERSTLLSQQDGASSKDRSGTTPKEYMDIAVKSDERARKYAKDLEEKPILDSVEIIEDPQKTLKKYGVDIECEEEETDTQAELEPEIERYQETTKTKEIVEETKTCEESEPVLFQCARELSLSCAEKKEGGAGGLTKGIVPSDMKWEFKDSVVTIGTNYHWRARHSGKRDARWNYICNSGKFDRNITFNILDLSNFSEFKLIQATLTNTLLVKVNGTTVYSDQDKTKLRSEKRYMPNGAYRGALVSRQVGLNVDLKPYLKEGENNIWIQVSLNENSDQIEIHTKQKPICSKWKEEWENKCEQDLKQLQ